MKVLIINDYAAGTGGAERFLENLLHESEHAAIDFHRLNIADLVNAGKVVHRSNFINLRYRRIRVIPEIADLITDRIEAIRPDLIHLNNNHLYTNSVVHSLNATGLSTVWFIHDAYTVRRLQSVLYIQAGQNFRFLTHSQVIYSKLLALRKQAFLVRVPFNFIKWATPEARLHEPRPLDLLYVGRIEKGKGVFTLMKAFELIRKRIPAIKLSFVGDGSQMTALKKMVKDRKLTGHILISGIQHDDNLLRDSTMWTPGFLFFRPPLKHWDMSASKHRLAGHRSSPSKMRVQAAGAGTIEADLSSRAAQPENSPTKYWKSSTMT